MEDKITDYQFKKILQMVLEIIRGSDSIEEAEKKINALLNE